MITGTNHFFNKSSADKYYSIQGFSPSDVARKIENNEIKIGPPETKNGQKLLRNNDEGRYFIQESLK